MEYDKPMLTESSTSSPPSPHHLLNLNFHTHHRDAPNLADNDMMSDPRSNSPGRRRTPSQPFHKFDMGVPVGTSADSRLAWLRSQIIGGDALFDSPFGPRRLTYADHTASGRCLRYVENFIMDNVLPFYGKPERIDKVVN
ncbi:hypothetical protein MLD38_028429 [Melastoma candidum]|uniref:Uncharacterized protein n=1 Tax=Melastoma candidum TaxID=119954 RepID=A0ACB9N3C3_9MYRT|nr:hypothetical protein MLD38_028429 [Melastoma candidum]